MSTIGVLKSPKGGLNDLLGGTLEKGETLLVLDELPEVLQYIAFGMTLRAAGAGFLFVLCRLGTVYVNANYVTVCS